MSGARRERRQIRRMGERPPRKRKMLKCERVYRTDCIVQGRLVVVSTLKMREPGGPVYETSLVTPLGASPGVRTMDRREAVTAHDEASSAMRGWLAGLGVEPMKFWRAQLEAALRSKLS